MVGSPRPPDLVRTSEKRPRVDDASKRPGIEEYLPWDVLEQILGCLDIETLCTARMVSKTFCAAASAHVCSLTLPSTSQAGSFLCYPHLRHVTVTHVYTSFQDEQESLAQLDPRIRDLTTVLTIRQGSYSASSITETRDYLSHAALMPKLQKLEVKGDMYDAALLPRCTNIEALALHDCCISDARTIVTLTQLTSLDIGKVWTEVDSDGSDFSQEDISWLKHATNLRSLRALSIDISNTYGALSLMGNLTGLTGLTMYADREIDDIVPLTRLTLLRSLSIRQTLTERDLGIACSLGTGSLVNLELCCCLEASADCGRFLSRQTALTRLSLDGLQLCNVRHIRPLRIELLQCLRLEDFDRMDAVGASVLRRASSLTKLCLGLMRPLMGLSQVVARLTQLRSLSLRALHDGDVKMLDLPVALSPLAGLTKLAIRSRAVGDGDLRALLVLTGLRKLHLDLCRLTDDMLPELGALTSLSTLKVAYCDVTSLAPVSKVLDPLRKARGLRLLHTYVV